MFERRADGAGWEIHGQKMNADGTLNGGDFFVAPTNDEFLFPALAYNSIYSNFLAVYDTSQDGQPKIGYSILGDSTLAARIWKGSDSFSITKTIEFFEGAGKKLDSAREVYKGFVELYMGEEGLEPNADGCYAFISSDDKQMTICIKNIASISSDLPKNRTDQLILLGSGDFNLMDTAGVAILDAKGILNKDRLGQLDSIRLNGRVQAGTHGRKTPGTGDLIFKFGFQTKMEVH